MQSQQREDLSPGKPEEHLAGYGGIEDRLTGA